MGKFIGTLCRDYIGGLLMGKIVFVTGGVKSGKSKFVENLASNSDCEKIGYIATESNKNKDSEMMTRVKNHQARRPDSWKTFERYRDIGELIVKQNDIDGYIIDCITLLITNLFFDKIESNQTDKKNEGDYQHLIDNFSTSDIKFFQDYLLNEINLILESMKGTNKVFWIVSSEIGMGVAPNSKLGRIFCDYCGMVNQRIALESNEFYTILSGFPLKVK